MKKRKIKYKNIDESVERFRKLTTNKIKKFLNSGSVTKEGRIAYKQVLKERGEDF